MTNDSAARTLLLLSGESFANVFNKLGFYGFYFMDFKVRDRMSELFSIYLLAALGVPLMAAFVVSNRNR
jgi:hypothetical protein